MIIFFDSMGHAQNIQTIASLQVSFLQNIHQFLFHFLGGIA
jgi:hypothetical protein